MNVRGIWDTVSEYFTVRNTASAAAITAALVVPGVPTAEISFSKPANDAGIVELAQSYIPVISIKTVGGEAFAQNRPGTDDGCNAPGGCTGPRGGDNTANANAQAKAQLKANFLSLGLNAAATAISADGCTVTTGWGVGGGAYGFGLMFNKSEFGDNEQQFFVTCTHYRQLTDILKAMSAMNSCPGVVYAIEAMATTARDQRGRVLMQGNPALQALNATPRGQGLLAAVGLQCRLPAPPRK